MSHVKVLEVRSIQDLKHTRVKPHHIFGGIAYTAGGAVALSAVGAVLWFMFYYFPFAMRNTDKSHGHVTHPLTMGGNYAIAWVAFWGVALLIAGAWAAACELERHDY